MFSAKSLAPLLFWCLLAPAALPAQEKPAETFSDSTSVVLVEVAVNVVDSGKAVRDLKAENFRVFDGKQEQALKGFEVIDLEVAQGAAQARVPMPARRRFLLFFDLAFTPRGDVQRGLIGARQLLAGLDPSDVVALAGYTRGHGAELFLNFTTDRKQAAAVLDGLADLLDGKKAPILPGSQGRDPLRLVVDQGLELAFDVTTNDIAGEALEGLPASGGGGVNKLADDLAIMTRANVARNRDLTISYFRAYAEALKQFAQATSGLDGRRFFVFFSRGFDSSIFGSDFLNMTGSSSELSSGNPIGSGGNSALQSMKTAIDEFRRTGWEIQSVDAGRKSPKEREPQMTTSSGPNPADSSILPGVDSLLTFAKDTGGTLYRNFNNLGSAMGQMLGRTSVTYLLTFQIEGMRQDGAYHPIRVELRGAPRGSKVYHRDGFFSPRPGQVGIAKVVSTAEQILSSEESGDLELHTLLVPLKAAGGKARVATLIETSGSQLLAGHQGEELEIEAYAYAIDSRGEVEDFLAQQIRLDTSKMAEELAAKRFGIFSDLALAPGKYQVRVLLRQRRTGRYVLASVPLEVPNLAAEKVSLSALMMLEQQGNDPLLIREKKGDEVVSYPFRVADEEFFPALQPTLDTAGKRRMTLFGYGLRGSGISLGLELVGEDGKAYPGKLQVVGAAPTDEEDLDRIYLLLDPQGLAAGTYEIRAQVSGEKGEVYSATSSVFAVGAL